MTTEQQAIWLNAVPLLALGVVYLAAGASLVPAFLRRAPEHGAGPRARARARLPLRRCGGDRLRAARPPRPRAHRRLGLAGARRDPARARARARPVRRGSASARCCSPGRASQRAAGRLRDADHDRGGVARARRARGVGRAHGVRRARCSSTRPVPRRYGVVAIDRGEDVAWFPDVRLDLANEPSGVASAYHDAAAFAVYDAQASQRVSARLVEATGARSVAYVPLIADQRVIGVLVVAATTQAARVLRRRPRRAPGARRRSRSRDRAALRGRRTTIASRSSPSSPLGSGPTPTSTRCSSTRSPSSRKRCAPNGASSGWASPTAR